MIFLLDNLKGYSGKNKSDMKTIILTPPPPEKKPRMYTFITIPGISAD